DRPVAPGCAVLTSVAPGDASGDCRCGPVARPGYWRECRDFFDHQQSAASHAAGEGSSTTRPADRHADARAKLELSDLVGDSQTPATFRNLRGVLVHALRSQFRWADAVCRRLVGQRVFFRCPWCE